MPHPNRSRATATFVPHAHNSTISAHADPSRSLAGRLRTKVLPVSVDFEIIFTEIRPMKHTLLTVIDFGHDFGELLPRCARVDENRDCSCSWLCKHIDLRHFPKACCGNLNYVNELERRLGRPTSTTWTTGKNLEDVNVGRLLHRYYCTSAGAGFFVMSKISCEFCAQR